MANNVIVGAGTSGITIAKNLDTKNTILIDKSKLFSYPFFYRVPLFIGLIFNNPKYIKAINLKENNRILPLYESNVIGGASEINGCVHAFGNKTRWKEALKNTTIDINDIQNSYSEIFSYKQSKNTISLRKSHTNEIDKLFFNYLKSLEYIEGDMSFSDQEIYGPITLNVGYFFRSSVKKFINTFKKKSIQKGVEVHDIEFDSTNNVIGVNTSMGFISAKKVILSAGTVGTNKILLNTKRKLKVLNRHDPLPEKIGNFVQDHPNLRIKVYTKENYETLNEINSSVFLKVKNFLKHSFGMSTFYRSTGASSAAYFDFNKDGIVDTKLQIVQFTEKGRLSSNKAKMEFDSRPGFSIAITIIDPKSYGSIKLDEIGQLNIEPKYFDDNSDIELAKEAIKFIMKFLNSDDVKNKIDEISDYDFINSNIVSFINSNYYSGYHLIGGCSPNKCNVIDESFKVIGVNGLYVCDASCFDTHVSSNSHAPVIMLADSFSRSLYEL